MYTASSMSHCPALIVSIDRKTHRMEYNACSKSTLACGFCAAHQYCHDTLLLLSEIGFPALQINRFLQIERGVQAWEEYIIRIPAPGVRYKFVEPSTPRFVQLFIVADEYRKSVYPSNARIAEAFARFQMAYFDAETTEKRPNVKKASHSMVPLNFGSQCDTEHVAAVDA